MKYIGSVSDGFGSWCTAYQQPWQNRRIYNDEVTRPDKKFCYNRMKYFQEWKYYWSLDACTLASDIWRCMFEGCLSSK